jgi:hypothetical protein
MSAIFPAHNFECSADYYSVMKSTFSHMHRVIKMLWYSDMHFKQQTVSEIFVAEKE